MESTDIIYFLMRWLHYVFGIIWIGHLYYFNFTQVPFFGETDAATKSNAIQKLVPRALWWFRWGAMFTFITGVIMLSIWGSRVGGDAMKTSFGLFISVGAIIATLMFLNVWLIIWPCQKVVIESTTNVAQGKPALPDAAAKGASALLASRSNTMFSIPMLFFMGAASHLTLAPPTDGSVPNYTTALGAATVLIALLEANAIKGKLGPLASVKGVIHAGLGLTAVLFAVLYAMA
jgi:uncharacterized membrane protein